MGSEAGANHIPGSKTIAAIPAYNEGAAICSVILATRHYVDEVLVVDDGSTDETSRLAEGAGATVIRHAHNRGKAAGIMTACAYAGARDASGLVLLDGDGQHDPAYTPNLLSPILDGSADVVVGSRFLDVANPIPFYRTLGLRVLNLATWLGSGRRCSDSQSGFRALGPAAFTRIQLRETFYHGFAVESEMQFEVTAHQLRLIDVPIQVRYGEKARRNPAKHGFGVLYRVLAIAAARRFGLGSGQLSKGNAPQATMAPDAPPAREVVHR